MAVAILSNTGESQDAAASPCSITTFNSGTGSNVAMVVIMAWDHISVSNVAVHWDTAGTNQAMTLILAKNAGDSTSRVEIWGLIAPTQGLKTLSATWTGTAEALMEVITFTGVDQGSTASFRNPNSSNGSTANPSLVVTSQTGDFTVAAASTSADIASGNTNTLIQSISGSGAVNVIGTAATGAASVTHSITLTAVAWAYAGIDIAAVGTVSSDTLMAQGMM